MKTLIAAREKLARQIKETLIYGDVELAVEATDTIALRQRVHWSRPAVVVLDEHMSNEWEALKAVPRMVLVRSRPRVILVSDDDGAAAARRAAEHGCFDLVTRRRGWKRALAVSIAAALADRHHALAAELSRAEEHSRLLRASLH